MVTKIKPLCVASMIFLVCIQSAQAKETYTPEEYLKNYALSVCIAEGYSAKEVKNDAAAAARGYMEFGDYSLEALSGRWQKNFWQSTMTACLGSR